MKKLFIILLLLPVFSFAQKEKKVTPKKQAKIVAIAHIQQLKESVLLVRLSARKNSINAMRKAGKEKMAIKKEKEQQERNLQIIAAFRTNFNFCKVFFFYSEDSDYIRNNQLDSVAFLNDSLHIDFTIKIDNPSYYTAEFGSVDPDANKKSTTSTFIGVGSGPVGVKKSSGGITITALVIKDNQLVQLAKPFPYYIREFKGLPFRRAILKMVLKMDVALNDYYVENK